MNKAHKISIKAPGWLPEGLRSRLKTAGRLHLELVLSPAERKATRRKKRSPVSQWAEKNRVLTFSSIPGPWRNSVTPYLVGIMDASVFPSVDTIIMCKGPQGGGTEAAHNYVGNAIDEAPGPVLYVYPNEQTARENCSDRIQPMINNSSRLKGYKTGYEDDATMLRIKLRHMQIYMAWAGSAMQLANRSIRHLILDEIDKYTDTAGKREADPISLAEQRTTTYKWNRKIWKISTPTIEAGNIWTALNSEAQVIFDYWVCCPVCGQRLKMDFEHIKWPKGERDWRKIETEQLAWYECQHCSSRWADVNRNMAVRMGQWQDRETGTELFDYLNSLRPKKIGFHLPAWLFYFVSLSECAAAFLRGQKKYNPHGWREKLKNFMNQYKAEPWVNYSIERSVDRILALCDDRKEGMVPGSGRVAALTAGVDTQDYGFWYEIRAWGWGQTQESWCIRAGYVTTFEAVQAVLWEHAYYDSAGNEYLVLLTVQDAMGHRTAAVYDFARMNRRRLVPYQGVDKLTAPYSWSKIDCYPGTQKEIPGGIKLLRANTNYYKDRLASALEIAPADPGAWHYYKEFPESWAQQMTVEYVDEKTGLWVCPEHKANHLWDCSVLNLVAADIMGVKHWKKPSEVMRPPRQQPKQKTQEERRSRW